MGCITSLWVTTGFSEQKNVKVSGFARSFITQTPIKNASITVLETGAQFKTNSLGTFSPIDYPIGKTITLRFKKFGYKTTQSASIRVPAKGLHGRYDNISFQVPSILTYYLFSIIMGAKIDDQCCHVTTTVTAYHKTLDDEPQGEPGAIITLNPSANETPFYFDIFKSGPLKNKTNPFTQGLRTTSLDGGVAFINLPPRAEPYTLSAQKIGVSFTSVSFVCRKGEFINISPPQGPTVIGYNKH